MLTLTKKPPLFERYGLMGFDICARFGEIGSLLIDLRPERVKKKQEVEFFRGLQENLGEEVRCSYDDWSFCGSIHDIAVEAPTSILRLTLKDNLAKVSSAFRSQVYADQTIEEIIAKVLPSRFTHECLPGFGSLRVKLAIQYQESDFASLKRLINSRGGQIWSAGDTIYVGAILNGKPKVLRLGSDILDYAISTSLGPEEVALKSMGYKENTLRLSRITLPEKDRGRIQESTKTGRRKHQGKVCIHGVVEDDGDDSLPLLAKSYLSSGAAGRLVITGMLDKLLNIGTCINVVDGTGGSSSASNRESLIVRALKASWRYDTGSNFYFEACAPEGLLEPSALTHMELHASPAVVEETNDNLNRVRVIFPWDENECVTPWLRIASPYWGDGHMHYIPPKKGDTVLVVWGQDDLDPIVLGCLCVGQSISESSESFVLKTDNGQTILIGKKNIKIVNESGGGKSEVEILPNKIVMDSDKIEFKTKKFDVK